MSTHSIGFRLTVKSLLFNAFVCDRFVDDSIMDAEDKVSKGFPPHAKFVLGTNENNLAIRP